MITLDGVELNPSLYWAERLTSYEVAQTARRTLGGRLVINSAPLYEGGLVTLVATQDTGWINTGMMSVLRAKASIPGLVMYLTFHEELIQVPVVFRHHEPPALELVQLTPKKLLEPRDYYIGTIKLIRV